MIEWVFIIYLAAVPTDEAPVPLPETVVYEARTLESCQRLRDLEVRKARRRLITGELEGMLWTGCRPKEKGL